MSVDDPDALRPRFREPQVNIYSAAIEKSIHFYRDVLGFPETFRTPAQGPPDHVELRVGPMSWGIATCEALASHHGIATRPGPPRGELALWVDDVDSAFAWLVARGTPPEREPENFGNDRYTLRDARLRDPDGNRVVVFTRVPEGPPGPNAVGASPRFSDPLFNLYVKDVERSLRLYRDALGFSETFRTPRDGDPEHVEVTLGDLCLGISTVEALRRVHGLDGGGGPPRSEVVLWVDDADAAHAWLTSRGYASMSRPHDFARVLRSGWVADPDGNPVQLVARRIGA